LKIHSLISLAAFLIFLPACTEFKPTDSRQSGIVTRTIGGKRWKVEALQNGIYDWDFSPSGSSIHICVGVAGKGTFATGVSERDVLSRLVADMQRYNDSGISAEKVRDVPTKRGLIPFYRLTCYEPKYIGIYRSRDERLVLIGFETRPESDELPDALLSSYIDKLYDARCLPQR
jgi:hypothetical protein